jgi:hypothetical protein
MADRGTAKMDDEADTLGNLCMDLVSLRRSEPALVHLFRDTLPGAWVPVRELYERAGLAAEPIKAQLVAAWLPSPCDPDYAVIVFFDDETKWSLTAECHAARLIRQHPQSPVAAAG